MNDTQTAFYGYLLTNDPQFKNDYDLAWLDLNATQRRTLETLSVKWSDKKFYNEWDSLNSRYLQLKSTQESLLDAAKSGYFHHRPCSKG